MRLLIIEDEAEFAGSLKKILERKGFAVDVTSNAEKALTRLELYGADYALVLLDLSLPDLDGMELLQVLRERKVATPVVVLTGRNSVESKIDLLNSGADDYIVKPFSSEELIARINTVLRRPKEAKPTVYAVGALEVDTAARTVRAGEKQVTLTVKEYSLLECFLRKPNQVVTREELSSQLWDFESESWSNVLDVHMKNLRKKLAAGETSVAFETVRGVGYRLAL